jgi:imidazolonepropionase-like amidohydrolase
LESRKFVSVYADQAVDGVRVIDATGKFVMPGTFSAFIDSSSFSRSIFLNLKLKSNFF